MLDTQETLLLTLNWPNYRYSGHLGCDQRVEDLSILALLSLSLLLSHENK